jgi:hypothetical protein
MLWVLQQAGYTGKVKIGMDVAASEFYTEDKKYDLDFKTKDESKKSKTDIKTGLPPPPAPPGLIRPCLTSELRNSECHHLHSLRFSVRV